MSPVVNKHSKNVFWFDLCPNNESNFISVYIIIDDKISIIETGPASSHDTLLAGIKQVGLSPQDIDYIIPTHIHLDHFGGGGHMMDVCTNAKSIVHPNAYKHVSSIDRWWSGSHDFLGDIADLYGKPKSIPEERLISAEDGFELSLGGQNIRGIHTPGHAPHHITWIYKKEAFVGDSAGLWYPNIGNSFPVTPGYYRHDLALESIEKMDKLDLEYIHYTHFGPRVAKGVFGETLQEFKLWMEVVEKGYNEDKSPNLILNDLFDIRPGLKATQSSHGPHQTETHLGTVEGMIHWIRRRNAKG
mgnify:FL=1